MNAIVPAIHVPDTGLGPAMQRLSPAHRAFVFAKVQYGLSNTAAARAAGYSTSTRDVAKANGYRLAHDPAIQEAIQEQSKALMRAEAPRSIRTIVEIRDNKTNEAKDRLKAALELLNRSGMGVVQEHHVVVENLSEAEKDKRILALARELGLPDAEARKLLIAPDAIDAEFTEVEPERSPEERARLDRDNARRAELARMTPEAREAFKTAVREQRRADMKARYQAAQEPDDLADLLAPEGASDEA